MQIRSPGTQANVADPSAETDTQPTDTLPKRAKPVLDTQPLSPVSRQGASSSREPLPNYFNQPKAANSAALG